MNLLELLQDYQLVLAVDGRVAAKIGLERMGVHPEVIKAIEGSFNDKGAPIGGYEGDTATRFIFPANPGKLRLAA